MNKRLKTVMAAVVLMGAMAMVQGCGGNREEAKAGHGGRVLTVATEAAYPPFRYMDKDRHLVGFEIDLAKEIGRRMGAEIEIRDMPFDRLLDAVAGKQVDMAIGRHYGDRTERKTGGLFRFLLQAQRLFPHCKKRKSPGPE